MRSKKLLERDRIIKYRILNIPEDEKDVDMDDYLDFSNYFGYNYEVYKKLKDFKNESEVSWEDIKKLRVKDIDLINGTAKFDKQSIFDIECKNLFNDLSIEHQDFVCVHDSYSSERYYLVDSLNKDVIKITDDKMIELINNLHINTINAEEEQWLLNKEKSGYTTFESFEERKQIEKEKELVFDSEYSSIKI